MNSIPGGFFAQNLCPRFEHDGLFFAELSLQALTRYTRRKSGEKREGTSNRANKYSEILKSRSIKTSRKTEKRQG